MPFEEEAEDKAARVAEIAHALSRTALALSCASCGARPKIIWPEVGGNSIAPADYTIRMGPPECDCREQLLAAGPGGRG